MARRGIALTPGQWISSGAVTGVHRRRGRAGRWRLASTANSPCPALIGGGAAAEWQEGERDGDDARRERLRQQAADRVGRYRWVICRPALRRHRDQLYRPADDRRAEADARRREFALDRERLCRHRLLVPGRLRDRLSRASARSSTGSARGSAMRIAVVIWTIAHMAHGGVYSAHAVRHGPLRRSASANPATSRPASRRSPTGSRQKERALAIGIFNAGANVGAILTPLIVRLIALGLRLADGLLRHRHLRPRSGWSPGLRSIATSARARARLGAAELAHIEQDPADPAAKVRGLAEAADAARDLGLRARQVLHRPDLVVLSLLAARLSSASNMASTCKTWSTPTAASRSAPSTSFPTSAASPAAGSPRG